MNQMMQSLENSNGNELKSENSSQLHSSLSFDEIKNEFTENNNTNNIFSSETLMKTEDNNKSSKNIEDMFHDENIENILSFGLNSNIQTKFENMNINDRLYLDKLEKVSLLT